MPAVKEDAGVAIVDQGVPEAQRSMSLEKIFWSHFSPNFGPPTWMIGLIVAAAGLDPGSGLAAILIGNVVGCVPTALSATMGPVTGLTQIENSRFAFGRSGTRVPAGINAFMCVGWVAVANVPATLALIAFVAYGGVSLPFWVALAVLSAFQLVAAIYGHHVVQLVQKYVGYFLVVAFSIVVAAAAVHGGISMPASHPFAIAPFALAISVASSNVLSWAPYSSDYTRYAPKSTSKVLVFTLVFVGLAGSSIVMEMLGFMTAKTVTDLSPAGFIAGLAALSGGLAPLVLVIVALSSVAGSVINATTASYSLISSGVKIPRTAAALIVGILAYVITVIGAGRFTTVYSNYLILLLYWISPWIGIVLADWYLRSSVTQSRQRAWKAGATIFVVITPLTILLFSATDVYTGPIAKLLGGVDVGYYVGFFAAAALYLVSQRLNVTSVAPGNSVTDPELA